MTNPTPDEIAIYEKVNEYLWEKAQMRRFDNLSANDSLFNIVGPIVSVGGFGEIDSPWVRYQEGYYDAAFLCTEKREGGTSDTWLVYPILFLYRHYLELMIKGIIMEAAATFQVQIPSGTEGEHNLVTLWDMLRDLVLQNHVRRILGGTDAVRRILAQFTDIDPFSMETRYGLSKDLRTPSMPRSRQLSLENIQEVMGKMYNALNQLQVNFQYAYEAFFQDYSQEDLL